MTRLINTTSDLIARLVVGFVFDVVLDRALCRTTHRHP